MAVSSSPETVVFERSNNRWGRRGDPIEADIGRRSLAQWGFAEKGHCVALSGKGDTLAIGNFEKTCVEGGECSTSSFWAEVYFWNGSSWEQLGDDILESPIVMKGSIVIDPPKTVAISYDGTVLAVGLTTFVFYEDKWIKRRSIIDDFDAGQLIGWSVDLSEDGSIVALGTSYGVNGNDSTRVLEWTGTEYKQLWNSVRGGEMNAIALSHDGSVLAVGLPFADFLPNPKCHNGTSLLRLSRMTDRSPRETGWEMVNKNSSTVLFQEDGLDRELTTFVEEACLAWDECFEFTVFDTGDDGISLPGGYSIYLDGEKQARGGNFSALDRQYIGNCGTGCSEGTSHFRVVINMHPFVVEKVRWSLDDEDGSAILHGGPYAKAAVRNLDGSFIVMDEIFISASSCATFGITSVEFWTMKGLPSSKLTWSLFLDGRSVYKGETHGIWDTKVRTAVTECPQISSTQCAIDSILLRIEVNTNGYPLGSSCFLRKSPLIEVGPYPLGPSWFLGNGSSPLIEGGSYSVTDFEREFVQELCVKEDECLMFEFQDTRRGGFGYRDQTRPTYAIFAKGAMIARGGGSYGGSIHSFRIGTCTSSSFSTVQFNRTLFGTIKDTAVAGGITDEITLNDQTSPEYDAIAWLAHDDAADVSFEPADRIQQRFALAVMYLSTRGENWSHKMSFLDGKHECEWGDSGLGVVCDDDKRVTELNSGM